MNIYDQIKTMADEMAGDLVAQRRDFHKYAEPGWFEMRTSSIIARKLTDLGYEVLVGTRSAKRIPEWAFRPMRSWRNSMSARLPRGRSGVREIHKGRDDRCDRDPALR